MKKRVSKELISAYYDGETSSKEQADVLRALETGTNTGITAKTTTGITAGITAETIQQELADHKRLSELLQDQPQESAPIGFLAQVLQAAERETLLTEDQNSGLGSESETNRQASFFKQSVGVLLTVAATLFVAVGVSSLLPTTDSQENSVAHNESGSDEPTLADDAELVPGKVVVTSLMTEEVAADEPKAGENADEREEATTLEMGGYKGDPRGRMRSKVIPKTETAANGETKRFSTKNSFPVKKPLPPGPSNGPDHGTETKTASNERKYEQKESDLLNQSGLPHPEVDGEGRFLFSSDLQNVKVGQVVEALETDGEYVAVVRLTVVDRQKGLEALHVLLSRNQIPLQETRTRETSTFRPGGTQPEELLQKNESTPSVNPEGELVGVYVEATSEQLQQALQQMQKQRQFLGLAIQPSLQVAQLEKDANTRLSERKSRSDKYDAKPKAASGPRLSQSDAQSGDTNPAPGFGAVPPAGQPADQPLITPSQPVPPAGTPKNGIGGNPQIKSLPSKNSTPPSQAGGVGNVEDHSQTDSEPTTSSVRRSRQVPVQIPQRTLTRGRQEKLSEGNSKDLPEDRDGEPSAESTDSERPGSEQPDSEQPDSEQAESQRSEKVQTEGEKSNPEHPVSSPELNAVTPTPQTDDAADGHSEGKSHEKEEVGKVFRQQKRNKSVQVLFVFDAPKTQPTPASPAEEVTPDAP